MHGNFNYKIARLHLCDCVCSEGSVVAQLDIQVLSTSDVTAEQLLAVLSDDSLDSLIHGEPEVSGKY